MTIMNSFTATSKHCMSERKREREREREIERERNGIRPPPTFRLRLLVNLGFFKCHIKQFSGKCRSQMIPDGPRRNDFR